LDGTGGTGGGSRVNNGTRKIAKISNTIPKNINAKALAISIFE